MAWLWTPQAAAALAGSHTAVSRVDIWHAGRPVYTLTVTGGSVSTDNSRPVLANLSCTLVDPTGALSTGDVGDLLNPYDCEIAPWRGVRVFGATDRIAGYRDELAPLGVYGLTSRDVSDSDQGLIITLAGQDRAMRYQVPLDSALAIPGSTPVEEAIIRLLSAVNPAVNILSMITGYTVGPLLYAPDIDVWGEAQKLAASVGGQLYHDRTGQCVFRPTGPASRNPVASYAEGDGLLLSADRQEDSDTIRNVVVMESPDGAIRAVVEDDDPTSPTYAGGRYGHRPVTIKNQYFGSIQQATQAASARLAYELGRSETTTYTIPPNAGIDPDDVTTVHRPRAGLNRRNVVVATTDIPLGVDRNSPTQPMKIVGRKSVLTTDGRVLDPIDDSGTVIAA